MPRQLLTDAAGKPYYAPPPLPMAGDVDSETNAKLESAERIAREEQIARENAAKLQADAQRYGSDAALKLYQAKRDDTPSDSGGYVPRPPGYLYSSGNRGYKNGGPVIKGEFKHANPTYAAYAKDGDGSLLAKGRK